MKAFEECIEKVRLTTKIPRKRFQSEGKFPIVSQEEDFINGRWDNESDIFKVERPVIIFGDHTQVLKYVDFDFVLGADGVKILCPKDFLSPKFFYYFLHANPLKSLGYARHYRQLKTLEVNYPNSLPEQERIVGILDEAFEGIATATAQAEKNLHNARELFQSVLQSTFSPKGDDWVETTIGELVKNNLIEKPLDGNHGEIHPKKSDFVASGVPFLMASDLKDGSVDCENCNFISRKQADTLRKGFAKHGDVLISHKGTIGRAAVLDTELDYVMLTPQVTYYRVKEHTTLMAKYIYTFFKSPEFLRQLNDIAGAGSTRAYIGITKQLELPFRFPPLPTQQAIVEKLDALSEETKRLEAIYERKKTALAELKQSLLQKAFAGEL